MRSSAGSPISLRFPGQWFQSESGLHQNWMRDYDLTTGRYLQADPLGLIDGASVYGYALQNPGRYTDPRGEFAFDAVIGGVVGGIEIGGAVIGGAIAGAVAIIVVPTQLGDGTLPAEQIKNPEKAKARKAYKSYCMSPPPRTGNFCEDLNARLLWQKQCLLLRINFGEKYYQDQSHVIENSNLQRGIDRMQQELETKCPEYCRPIL